MQNPFLKTGVISDTVLVFYNSLISLSSLIIKSIQSKICIFSRQFKIVRSSILVKTISRIFLMNARKLSNDARPRPVIRNIFSAGSKEIDVGL